MRLIDANNLMDHACRDRLDSRELIWAMIENAPTIDAVEVIRCKDCKYGEPVYDLIGLAQDDLVCCGNARCVCVHKPNWYCADGERR